MRRIAGALLLIVILAAILVPSLVSAADWYDSYMYYKEITVAGSTDGAQTDYQIKITVHKGAGVDDATNVYLNNHTETTWDAASYPTDIRFTASDFSTLMDYWVEEWTADTATVWVEFDSIPIDPGEGTFALFYGNEDAADASSGADTFIFFDDFERGNDGDAVGGDWTVTSGVGKISTTTSYGGTRSCKVGGEGAVSIIEMDYVAGGGDYGMRTRVWKHDSNGDFEYIVHGDGTKKCAVYSPADESIRYYSGGWQDTGSTIAAAAWDLISAQDFDFTVSFSYDILQDDAIIKDGANMYNSATGVDVFQVWNGDVTVGEMCYIDDFLIYKYTDDPPVISAWGAETQYPAPNPPSPFSGTLVGDDNVSLEWTLGAYSDNAVIVRRLDRFPTSITDGTVIYNGTATDYDDMISATEENEFYYSAWGWNAMRGYSTTYTTLMIGGEGMSSAIYILAGGIIGLALMGISYWTKERSLLMMSVIVWLALCIGGFAASDEAWDMPYVLAAASAGIAIMCAFGWSKMKVERTTEWNEDADMIDEEMESFKKQELGKVRPKRTKQSTPYWNK